MVSLRRGIGFTAASFLVLNGLIGAGIFALPARMAEQAGAFSPWIFLLFGALMLSVVWCFGQLAARFNQTGGPVVYARAGFGPFVSFQTGWLYYLARATAISANVHVLLLYAGFLFPDVAEGAGNVLAIVTICLLLTATNIVGITRAVRTLDALTVIKLVPLLLLVGYGLSHVSLPVVPQQLPEVDTISAGALLTLYAFIGFETVVVTSGETTRPAQTIPRALIMTVIAIAVFYFLVQLVYWQVMGQSKSDEAPLIALADTLFGHWGAWVITLTAVFSVAANLLANMISTSRLTYAMALEHNLPSLFGKLHERFATPYVSILFLGLLACLLSLTGSFVFLAVASVLSRLVVYAVCIGSLMRVQWSGDNNTAWVKTVVIPLVALAVCGWALSQSTLSEWGLLASEAIAGTLIYIAWRFMVSRQRATD